MNPYDYFPKKEAPFCTQQIDEFGSCLKGLSVSHNVPLTLSTLLKLLPFTQHGTQLYVTTPASLGYDPKAVQYLTDLGIPFDLDKDQSSQGDIHLDCSANFLNKGNPKVVSELTQTGVQKYRKANLSIPVVSIDDSYTKRLEDYFGTGDGFHRAYQQQIGDQIKGTFFVVWGYGKVGKGITKSLIDAGAKCAVIDLNEKNLAFAETKGAEGILATDTNRFRKAILKAKCLVTATGVPGLVSGSPLAVEIRDSHLLLANMGAEDEFGPLFPTDRVLNKKLAFNFVLEEPTRMKFLDPIFYAHNLSAKLYVEGQLSSGLSPLPREEDLRIVNQWQSYWGIEVEEIFSF